MQWLSLEIAMTQADMHLYRLFRVTPQLERLKQFAPSFWAFPQAAQSNGNTIGAEQIFLNF